MKTLMIITMMMMMMMMMMICLLSGTRGIEDARTQKAKIKEELLPISWHPDRVMNCCIPEDEKKLWKQ